MPQSTTRSKPAIVSWAQAWSASDSRRISPTTGSQPVQAPIVGASSGSSVHRVPSAA